MHAQEPDIFSSDQRFVAATSGFLLLVGGVMLGLVLLWRLFGWELYANDWVPLFGGFDLFREDLAAINLPLAMIILGVGLRLYTPFGWLTCVMLLSLLCVGFSALAWRLRQELEAYWQQAIQQPQLAQEHPLFESIATNIGLAFLCALLLTYLWFPRVRSMFWPKR
jgi:hypothetical protein